MSTTERIYRPKVLTRRQFLGLGAAGAGLLLAGCGGGGQNYGEGGGGGGGSKEFHGAYPYQLPPTGHFNTFATNGIFALTLYQDVLEMPGTGQASERVEGMKEIKGRIALENGEWFALMDANDLLLTVEDGRVLPFLLGDNSGTIAARGIFK